MLQPSEPTGQTLLYAAILGIGGFVSHVAYKVLTPLWVKRVEAAATKIDRAEADQAERLEKAEYVIAHQAEQLLALSVEFATAKTELGLLRTRLEGIEGAKRELRAELVDLSARFEQCDHERAELRIQLAMGGWITDSQDDEGAGGSE